MNSVLCAFVCLLLKLLPLRLCAASAKKQLSSSKAFGNQNIESLVIERISPIRASSEVIAPGQSRTMYPPPRQIQSISEAIKSMRK